MTFREVVLRYQTYNSATGRFDVVRSRREYADLVGVPAWTLNRVALGEQPFNLTVARALARTFPETRDVLADMILDDAALVA